MYVQWNVIQPGKEEGNFVSGDIIDEPWGYYSEWNKADTERNTALGLWRAGEMERCGSKHINFKLCRVKFLEI